MINKKKNINKESENKKNFYKIHSDAKEEAKNTHKQIIIIIPKKKKKKMRTNAETQKRKTAKKKKNNNK